MKNNNKELEMIIIKKNQIYSEIYQKIKETQNHKTGYTYKVLLWLIQSYNSGNNRDPILNEFEIRLKEMIDANIEAHRRNKRNNQNCLDEFDLVTEFFHCIWMYY